MFAALALMRLDKPVGIFLLWWPTAWALWMANQGKVPPLILVWFGLGTILMRSAGCVINDIADRRLDLHVQRTAHRPLTSGKISLIQAWLIFFGLLMMALVVLLQLPPTCFYYALISVFLSGLYPFCKRFLASPQTVLALAFSMGIPMAYVAASHPLDFSMWMLLTINIAWVLAYDTLYACVDREDDRRVGICSTALHWGWMTTYVVIGLFLFIQIMWLVIAVWAHFSWYFGLGWVVGSWNLWKQKQLLKHDRRDMYFQAFKLNSWYGLWMWIAILLGQV